MEKNRELYSIYLELGHEVFEEKIKKPMELYLHANGNVISMNSLNTMIANAMENSKLGEASFDEHDIFSPPTLEEKIYFDDTMPPIYDDYNDECELFSPPTIEDKIYYDYDMPPIYDDYHDDNDCFTLTIPNKKDFAYMESNDTFMLLDHGNNALCDSYIVEFIHDATEIYNKRGRHGSKYLNNKKFPFFMLKVLKFCLFCFPMLVALCFNNLFFYKIPMHRKYVRLKCVIYMFLDALLYASIIIFVSVSLKITMPNLKALKKSAFWETTHLYLLSVFFCFLSQGCCCYCNDSFVSFLFRFCAKSNL